MPIQGMPIRRRAIEERGGTITIDGKVGERTPAVIALPATTHEG
jgi:chemotaxis protein histidine kinase CheA